MIQISNLTNNLQSLTEKLVKYAEIIKQEISTNLKEIENLIEHFNIGHIVNHHDSIVEKHEIELDKGKFNYSDNTIT